MQQYYALKCVALEILGESNFLTISRFHHYFIKQYTLFLQKATKSVIIIMSHLPSVIWHNNRERQSQTTIMHQTPSEYRKNLHSALTRREHS